MKWIITIVIIVFFVSLKMWQGVGVYPTWPAGEQQARNASLLYKKNIEKSTPNSNVPNSNVPNSNVSGANAPELNVQATVNVDGKS